MLGKASLLGYISTLSGGAAAGAVAFLTSLTSPVSEGRNYYVKIKKCETDDGWAGCEWRDPRPVEGIFGDDISNVKIVFEYYISEGVYRIVGVDSQLRATTREGKRFFFGQTEEENLLAVKRYYSSDELPYLNGESYLVVLRGSSKEVEEWLGKVIPECGSLIQLNSYPNDPDRWWDSTIWLRTVPHILDAIKRKVTL